jgi:hypothetical protein
MLLFALYLIGCFLGGLAMSRQTDRYTASVLLVVCLLITAGYYWSDNVRVLHVSAPPLHPDLNPPRLIVAPIGRPSPAVGLAWSLFVVSAFVMAWRPRWGLCLLVFLTLVADPILAPWYPFAKGFSARESVLFVADWLIVSPLEVLLLIAVAGWLVGMMRIRRLDLPHSTLLLAAVVFGAWLAVGFIRGMASGGDVNVGLWELRGPSYVVAVLVLTSHYMRTKADVVRLTWAAVLAFAVEAVWITTYCVLNLGGQAAQFRQFVDHSTSVHLNTVLVLLAAAWLFRASASMRFGLPWLLPPVVLSYLVNQRRAPFIGLAVAVGLLCAAGLCINRRLALRVIAVVGVTAIAWLTFGWRDSGSMGLPARAVQSVFNGTDRSMKDRESDYYRVLEDTDIIATIRSHPWAGVGFGRPFSLVLMLPGIQEFVWWRYITHNSVLWIWMKAGAGGFVTLLFLWGVAITSGAEACLRVQDGDLGAIVATATLFVIMHAIFAYVDMAWDLRSSVYLGTMMGVIVSVGGLACARMGDSHLSP